MFTSGWKNVALTSLHCPKSYQDSGKLLQYKQRNTKICFGENLCNIYRRWVITITIDWKIWKHCFCIFWKFLKELCRIITRFWFSKMHKRKYSWSTRKPWSDMGIFKSLKNQKVNLNIELCNPFSRISNSFPWIRQSVFLNCNSFPRIWQSVLSNWVA